MTSIFIACFNLPSTHSLLMDPVAASAAISHHPAAANHLFKCVALLFCRFLHTSFVASQLSRFFLRHYWSQCSIIHGLLFYLFSLCSQLFQCPCKIHSRFLLFHSSSFILPIFKSLFICPKTVCLCGGVAALPK